MSHSVTVTRTTTTSSSSPILLNVGYLTTVPGILKVVETILGLVCLSIVAYYTVLPTKNTDETYHAMESPTIFFMLTCFCFLIGTFLMLLACVCNLTTSSLLSKTLFEFLYHLFAFVFYLSGSLALLALMIKRKKYTRFEVPKYDATLAASVLGLINAVLYLVGTIFSYRSYRNH